MDIDKIEHDEPDVKLFIITLRTQVLRITIDEFVAQMNLPNEKYYHQIVNGYIENNIRKYKNPTIKYLFTGINHALRTCENWKIHKNDIDNLVHQYLIKY